MAIAWHFEHIITDPEPARGLRGAADTATLAAIDFAGWSDMKIPAECVPLQRWYPAVTARPSARA